MSAPNGDIAPALSAASSLTWKSPTCSPTADWLLVAGAFEDMCAFLPRRSAELLVCHVLLGGRCCVERLQRRALLLAPGAQSGPDRDGEPRRCREAAQVEPKGRVVVVRPE